MPRAAVLGCIGAVLGGAVAYQHVTDARALVAHWQLVEATVLRIEEHTNPKVFSSTRCSTNSTKHTQ